MKRTYLSLLLALSMVLSLMPATALAAPAVSVTVGGVLLNADTPYLENGQSTAGNTQPADGYAYFDAGTNTLTLKNASINGALNARDNYGIYATGGNLTIALEGVNTVTAGSAIEDSSNEWGDSRGIFVDGGSLTVSGAGSLAVNGGDGASSYGIYATGVTITDSAVLEAKAATASANATGTVWYSCGIYSAGSSSSIAVQDSAKVTAVGNEAQGKAKSIGIRGVATTVGSKATVIAAGNTQALISTNFQAADCSITAATDTAGSNTETYDAGKIATYKYLMLAPKTAYVMEVDLDGDGANAAVQYENFADGWNAATGSGSTADITVKLLADWKADENGFFSTTTTPGFNQGSGTANNYTGSIRVPKGTSIVLDLNGHTVDRNLKSSKANGYILVVNGTLTLKDTQGGGTLTGGYDTEAGGISVYGGTFTMEGGTVSGNRGAGVYSLRSGVFHMKGGSITNNTYGIYFSDGTVKLSGTPAVTGNSQGNLYLTSGKTAAIDAGGLAAGADIGVTFSTWPTSGNSKTIATGNTGSCSGYFHSDKSGYEPYDENGTVKMRPVSSGISYTVTYDANGATSGSVPTDATPYSAGASVTAAANSGNLQKTCHTFAGWNTKADGSGDSYAAGSGTFSISADTILYAQWTEAHTFDANGFCEATAGETHYQPADLNGDIYEIGNAGQFYWFAEKVNGGDTAVNGALTQDIVLGGGESDPRRWTPIGSGKIYTGSFNGAGHTVSGLYIDTTEHRQGLFGQCNGTITNMTVTGTMNSSGDSAGGICGNLGLKGSISNCANGVQVTSTGNYTGGIVGYNYGTILNCYNTAKIEGALYAGGICGFNNISYDKSAWGTITNCYNTGTATSSTDSYYASGICGLSTPTKNTALFNNYCIEGTGTGCWWNSDNTIGFLEGAVELRSAGQFASGEVAYLLNGGQTDTVFRQTLGTDAVPQFAGATVYQVDKYGCPDDLTAEKAYSNTNSEIRGSEHLLLKWQADANGHWKTCAYCGLKFETGSHTGKTATCTQKAVCEICGQEYGGFAAHSYGAGWASDAANHWHECMCGNKKDSAAHIPTVINAKEATETETGYTGDVVCSICGRELKKGTEIPTKGRAPKIGDTYNPWLWTVLALTACCGAVGAAAYGRKKRNTKLK